jgi:hypothetical protein
MLETIMLEVTVAIIVAVLFLRWILVRAACRAAHEEACEERLVRWCLPPRG